MTSQKTKREFINLFSLFVVYILFVCLYNLRHRVASRQAHNVGCKIMCDLFSDVLWLATATNCSFQVAYNALMENDYCTRGAFAQVRGGYSTRLYCDEKIIQYKNILD